MPNADKLITLGNLGVFKQEILEEIPPVDSSLSTTSKNPVQNKVITPILRGDFSQITSISGSMASNFDNIYIYVPHEANKAPRRGWYQVSGADSYGHGILYGYLFLNSFLVENSSNDGWCTGIFFSSWELVSTSEIEPFCQKANWSSTAGNATITINRRQDVLATKRTILAEIAPSYSNSPSFPYRIGDIVYYNGSLFGCTRLNPSTPGTSGSGWTYLYNVQDSLLDYFSRYNLAPNYDTAGTYSVGDLCTYKQRVYRCISDISVAESWTAAHWELTTISAELSRLDDSPVDITDMGGIGGAPLDDGIFDAAIAADRLMLTDSGVTLHYQLQTHSEDAGTQSEGAVFKTSLLDIQNNTVTDQFLVLTNIAGTRSVEVKTPVAAAINTAY